jgi:2-polyprenyl-6-methoxyphenol hydroxylase-like FAD-dependent oxidoreductase
MKVVIVGAGIGGLVTALSLHRAGITDVTCLESAPEMRPLGVGINLLPHAVRELTELGLLDELDAMAVRTADLTYVNEFGQTIWNEPRGIDAGYQWPQFSIHRGKFQMMLARVVRERLGIDTIVTDARVSSIESGGELTRVMTSTSEYSADVVIAADGIHSTIRATWHPNEGPPIWNGAVLWRGTSRVKPFLSGRSMFMAGHRETKFVAYPLDDVGDDGLQLVNWIAEHVDPTMVDLQTNWNRSVPVERFLPLFESWKFDWFDIPSLITAADTVLEYPMSDRDPLDSWIRDRVVLLGDAAHPTYPIGSNGSSQAIIDARVLAFALATKPVEEALTWYQSERLPKTRAIQLANREMGPELVMQIVHERAPHGFESIDDVMTADERNEIAARYKSIAGFDPAILNTRGSWDATYAPSLASQ